ncbi:hypothetical protein QBC38DRAFT_469071 [Podospora fimiseda]|uniref:Uncharacterized protein n=1 Tax=Podospora fimiseda TaxID=252190 RepID=A0AAN7BW66_9PEZI|nr:hypothetical protein QBC38DRAFT_469071 [Podospora fimiseda]
MEGSKFPRTSGPRSLADMCISLAVKHIKLISSVDNMPAQYVTQLVRASKDPAQLRAFEQQCDEAGGDIYDLTAEHWQRLIRLNYNSLSMKHNFAPENPKDWHKVFYKYAQMQEEINDSAIALLVNRVGEVRAAKESRRAKILTINDSKIIPSAQRQRANGVSTHWSKQVRPKQTFLGKAKRQATTTAQRFNQTAMGPRTAVPFGKVAKAPPSMVNDVRISKQFDPRTAIVRTPTSKPSTSSSANSRGQTEGEARLLQIKKMASTDKAATILSFDDDGDDMDDLFGDKPQERSKPGVLTIEQIDSIHTTSSSFPKSYRPGLLSAAPGANRTGVIGKSPAKSGPSSTSPPLRSTATSSTPTRGAPNKTPARAALPTLPLSQSSTMSGVSDSILSAAEATAEQVRRESSAQEAELARLAALRKRKAQAPDIFMRRPNKRRA